MDNAVAATILGIEINIAGAVTDRSTNIIRNLMSQLLASPKNAAEIGFRRPNLSRQIRETDGHGR
jgi:hypothetical protein